MTKRNNKQKQSKTLQMFRKIHRTTSIFLFAFFFFVSVSGLFLGWKKHSGGLILPETYIGTSTDLKNWLPIDSLHNIACQILHDSVSTDLSLELDRIDIRKNKGVVKFIYKGHYWGIQLDGATGNLLHIAIRRSDFIENIHDGSIFDKYLGTSSAQISLVFTTVMGLALLTFTITGFWLWYGPKRKKRKNNNTNILTN